MRPRKSLLATLVVGVLVLGFAYLWRQLRPSEGRRGPEERLCVRVVDGDTIELDGGEHVRLIGVDTPESVDPRRPVEPFGKEASAFTRRMAEGKTVRLEFEEETVDTYGRTLAYVYLPDGTLLNREIIRQGYGHAYTRFPFRYEREFVILERQARAAGRGLWAR
jgi:micrococcal nuclease